MIEFDKNKIMQEKTVVHCNTYYQSINLLKWAKLNGILYRSIDINEELDNYKDKLCYNIFDKEYAYIDLYKAENYTILEYEDVILKLREKEKNDTVMYFDNCKLNRGVVWVTYEREHNQYQIKSENSEYFNINKEFVWFDSPDLRLEVTTKGFVATGERTPTQYSCPMCGEDIKSTISECASIIGAHQCFNDTVIGVDGNSAKDVYDNLCKFHDKIKIEK